VKEAVRGMKSREAKEERRRDKIHVRKNIEEEAPEKLK
jgi:hypothetical protein